MVSDFEIREAEIAERKWKELKRKEEIEKLLSDSEKVIKEVEESERKLKEKRHLPGVQNPPKLPLMLPLRGFSKSYSIFKIKKRR